MVKQSNGSWTPENEAGGAAWPFRAIGASPIGRRLAGGVAGNLVDKVAVLAVQLLSIAALTHYWGAEGYGTWVMLMTIPTYLALGDLGLGAAAQVEITRQVAAGRTDAARQVLQAARLMVSAVLGAVLAGVAGYAALATLGPLRAADGDVTVPVMVLLTALMAAVNLQSLLLLGVLRATHKYALSMLITAGILLLQGAAVIGVAAAGGSLVAAGAAQLLVQVAGLLAIARLVRRLEPWAQWRLGGADVATMRRLLRPSAAVLVLNLAAALSLQGMVLVMGLAGGPVAAASFAAARLLTRIPLQLAGLVTRASVPELTHAADATAVVRGIIGVNVAAALLATGPFLAVSWLLGPWLLGWISHGQLAAGGWVFGLLSLAAACSAVSDALAARLVAANRQGAYAYWYAGLTGLGLLLPLVGGDALAAGAAGVLAAEAASLAIVFARWRAERR